MHRLFATSSTGLYAFELQGNVTSVGLQGSVVSQTSARDGVLLAAVPVIHEVHKMMSYIDSDSQRQQPGLYKCDLSAGELGCKRVYDGNVKSCAIGKESASRKQRWYAGIEPADVLISEDNGATWSDTGSFKAIPARDSWYDDDPLEACMRSCYVPAVCRSACCAVSLQTCSCCPNIQSLKILPRQRRGKCYRLANVTSMPTVVKCLQ